jgi:hypothetical protein
MPSRVFLYKGTDVSDVTNYAASPDGTGPTGSLPSAGDTLVITTPNTLNAGLTALAAISLIVEVPSYSVTQVASGSSLTLLATSMSYSGQGALFSVTASASGAAVIASLTVATVGSTFQIVAGTVTNLKVSAGQVIINGSGIVTNLYNFGGSVTAAYYATGFTLVEGSSGQTLTNRNITTLNNSGTHLGIANGNAGITTANLNSGTINHRSSGTLTTVNARAGTFTPAGSVCSPLVGTLNLYGNNNTLSYVQTVGSISFSVTTTNNLGAVTAIVNNPVS